jgi:BlaI family transcriptional regulator, penicillinase repressor
MPRRTVQRPTEGELAILGVLWNAGPSTVRQVHEALGDRRGTGYTTTLKLMQIMAEKGLAHRQASGLAHVYEAAVGESHVQRRLVSDLIDKAFGGSARKLILQALETEKVTPAELKAVRALLKYEGDKR